MTNGPNRPSGRREEGDLGARRQFLGAFIRRIVLHDHEGVIEMVGAPALEAVKASGPAGGEWPGRRASNIPLDGTPSRVLSKKMRRGRSCDSGSLGFEPTPLSPAGLLITN